PEAVVITVGFQEAILLVLRTLFASPADILVVVQPCYVGAIGAARRIGGEVEGAAEINGTIDMDTLAATCAAARSRGRRVRALYVAPDHSNPSGCTLTLEQRQRLLDMADREDFTLLEDNAYAFSSMSEATL